MVILKEIPGKTIEKNCEKYFKKKPERNSKRNPAPTPEKYHGRNYCRNPNKNMMSISWRKRWSNSGKNRDRDYLYERNRANAD